MTTVTAELKASEKVRIDTSSDEWLQFMEWGEYELGFQPVPVATKFRRRLLHCSNLIVDENSNVKFQLVFPYIHRIHYLTGKCWHGVPLNETCISNGCFEQSTRKVFISREPGILGSCDCCGISILFGQPLLKQPLSQGFYCESCDLTENGIFRAEAQ